MNISVMPKKIGPVLGPFFVQKLAIFAQKSGFGHFLQSRTSDLSKPNLKPEAGLVALNHLMAVLCLGKFLFWLFGHCWSKIHFLWWENDAFGSFWIFSANLLMFHDRVLFNNSYGVFMNIAKWFLAHFGPSFGRNWLFLLKIKAFAI